MTHPFAVDVDTLSGMRPIATAVFSIGSNLGDRFEYLQSAVDSLRATPDLIVVDVSPVYETKAVGGPEDNPDFLNLVVVAETTVPPRVLLDRAQAIEQAHDRTREVTDGPRTLDVDVIVVGNSEVTNEALTLPHPRAHERAFVLVPWHDADPNGTIPGHGRIADLLADMDVSGVRRRDDLELEEP
jgi:2-amino-4-hydroxy-6-hydroxymethyldihydropteridine diphosphokinase